jgi:TRAP-type C4-dicarboxylate transport system permease small subunit
MNAFLSSVFRLSKWTNGVGGVVLPIMMIITVTDVFLRLFGKPIVGTYELVAYTGALVVAFSIPYTSWARGHIYVDFFVQKLSPGVQKFFHTVTRVMGIVLFFLAAWNLGKFGMDLARSGEVSPTLQLPFYPIVYAVGVSCLVQCLVLAADIVKIVEGKYE